MYVLKWYKMDVACLWPGTVPFKASPFALLKPLWTKTLLGQSSLPRDNFFSYAWSSATQLNLVRIFLLSGHYSEESCWLWPDKKCGDDEDSQIRSLKSCQARPRQLFPPWLAANIAIGLQTHPCHNAANKNTCCLANHLSPRYRAAQRRRSGTHMHSTEAHWVRTSSMCF